jgi:predicted outer membrane repeat protein
MHGKVAATVACAALGAMTAAGLTTAPAARAANAIDVPCSTPALVTAMTSPASGETLTLATGCDYILTAALPQVSQALTIDGHGATLERSSAPDTAAFTILTVDSGILAVSKLNFRNGSGAISVTDNGQLTVTGGTFSGNAAANGGAIYSDNAMYAPKVTGATFTQNTATGDGGAIYDASTSASIAVIRCTFTQNTATGDGGAIWESGYGGAATDSRFFRNAAASGGAVWLDDTANEFFSDVVVYRNTATVDGGGIYNSPGGNGVTINDSTISDNHARLQGGGVDLAAAAPSVVAGTTIHGNKAANGGGIKAATGGLVITDGTVSGNHASADGGGIYNLGTLEASHTEITSNRAASGGGIYDDGTHAAVALTSSTVTGNTPNNCVPLGSITGCVG